MEFDPPGGGGDGEHNRSDFVEIPGILNISNAGCTYQCFGTESFDIVVRNRDSSPSVSVTFISLVTSCAGLQQEEPQTAHLMSFTWASHIAASVLTGC